MPAPKERKSHTAGKITRAAAVLVALVALMLVVISVPAVRALRREMQRIGCNDALASAMRELKVDYLFRAGSMTPAEAKAEVTRAMLGWDDLCPGNGDVYLDVDQQKYENGEFSFDLVCGLHNADANKRTRLNADNVLTQLRQALATARFRGTDYPTELTVRLNGQDLVCYLTDTDLNFRRGTFATPGYSGTVAYYSVVGHSDFGADSGLEEGEIWYFTFADRDHCATWENVRGWYGDSWGNVAGEYGFGE